MVIAASNLFYLVWRLACNAAIISKIVLDQKRREEPSEDANPVLARWFITWKFLQDIGFKIIRYSVGVFLGETQTSYPGKSSIFVNFCQCKFSAINSRKKAKLCTWKTNDITSLKKVIILQIWKIMPLETFSFPWKKKKTKKFP